MAEQASVGNTRMAMMGIISAGCMLVSLFGCTTLPSPSGDGGNPAVTKAELLPAGRSEIRPEDAQEATAIDSMALLSIPDHPTVTAWVKRFSQEQRDSFQTYLYRAQSYVIPAQAIFEERGLPADLVYMALIESGFSPTARSRANAVGMWQFIAATGKRYGLELNRWIDERRHPFKSARAAADYLSFLYDTFGSWPLALAAYNVGENAVQGALDQTGSKTFWELAEGRQLPAKTRDFVAKLYAVVTIAREPERYGFHFVPQRYASRHEIVEVPGGMKLSWLGRQTGISEADLREHNPELSLAVVPPSCPSYELCVPMGQGETFRSVLSEQIAAKEESISMEQMAKQKSKSGIVFAKGKNLPATKTLVYDTAGSIPSQLVKASCRTVYHPVRQGDTLWSIAEHYRTSVATLSFHNQMNARQTLQPGAILKICVQTYPTGHVQ